MRIRLSRVVVAVCLVISFYGIAAAQAYPPSSTYLSTETSNNTSTCPSSGVQPPGCGDSKSPGYFTGLSDHWQVDSNNPPPAQYQTPPASQVQTKQTVPPGHNISKVPFNTLLYPGYSGAISTVIACHVVPWWGNQVHVNIAMDEGDTNIIYENGIQLQGAVVDRQITDMISRGCGVAVLDYYGPGSYEDSVFQTFLANMDARCTSSGCPIKIAAMEDINTGTKSPQGACGGNLECAFETDLNYTYQHYISGHPSYWTLNVAGCSNRAAFLAYSFEGQVNWANIKSYIHNSMGLNCTNEPLLATDGTNGLQDSNRDGAFNWVGVDYYWSSQDNLPCSTCDQNSPPTPNQFGSGVNSQTAMDGTAQYNPHFYPHLHNDNSQPWNGYSTDDWYWNARTYGVPYGKAIIMGSAYAGFNDTNANWGFASGHPNGRKMSQECGQVWLNSWARLTATGKFSSTSQIQAVGIPTWNDYEEGSAIEPGIDNCVSISDQAVNGDNYTFTLNLNDTTFASENTVYEYVIWYSTDGTGSGDHHLQQWTTVAPNGNRTYTVSLHGLPVTPALIYAEAIGKPSIFNHITGGQVYNPPVCSLSVTPSSLNFGNQTAGTTSSGQQVSVTAHGAACNITSLSISGAFAQSNNCPSTLGVGVSCQANVTFTPPGTGNYSGTLTVNSSNSSNGNPTVSLSGTGVAPGYTYTNIDDLSGWNSCGDPGCAGGNGTATYSLTQNVGSPSLDGGSAQFALTGGPAYSDIKWWNQQSLVSGSNFTSDLYVYITNTNAVQGLGFGVTQLTGGLKYSFRYMCDFRGTTHWILWNSAGGAWYDTGIACSASDFPSNSWIHLTFYFQHTTNNQMLYQSFTINGVSHTVNVTLNPEVQNDSPFIQFQILQWGDYEQDPYSVYVDDWNVNVQ